nr:ParM/StbA family protein [Anaerocolumna cellulosilytica]
MKWLLHIKNRRDKTVNNKIEVIGIDHGWSHMKTPTTVFTTSIKENPSPTFFKDVLEYKGKYYNIGGERLEIKNTKVENDDFYLLTLAAIAKELEKRGNITEATVYLAVGLPLTRFGEEKQAFIEYLSKNQEVQFKFEEKQYHIKIVKVSVYPQCYSAVTELIPNFQRRAVVVDIGSWTIDIMPVINKKPDDRKCNSLPHGLITCMREINRDCVKNFNYELEGVDIEHYIRHHHLNNVPEEVLQLVDRYLKSYADMVIRSLKELEINIQTTPIIIVGGGASVVKNYGSVRLPNIEYKLDVKANAKGYEMMARIALRNVRG